MKRLGILIAIAALAIPFTVSTAAPPCAPIEAQAWWLAPGEAAPGRHTHIGTCFPTVAVSGRITFPITVKWHEQPVGASATRIRIQDGSTTIWSQSSGLPSVGGKADVSMTVNATIDTDKLSTGRHELRFGAYTRQPDGDDQLVSSGWQLCVRSCSPRSVRSAEHWTEARGWYTGAVGYENARFLSPLPVSPIEGTWRPVIQCAAPSGASPNGCFVYLDPNFHAGDSGKLLYQAGGAAKTTLAIDTAKLTPGAHKLVIRTDAPSVSPLGIDSGVMVIGFTVGSGGPAIPSTAAPTAPPTAAPAAPPTAAPTAPPTAAPSVCGI